MGCFFGMITNFPLWSYYHISVTQCNDNVYQIKSNFKYSLDYDVCIVQSAAKVVHSDSRLENIRKGSL